MKLTALSAEPLHVGRKPQKRDLQQRCFSGYLGEVVRKTG